MYRHFYFHINFKTFAFVSKTTKKYTQIPCDGISQALSPFLAFFFFVLPNITCQCVLIRRRRTTFNFILQTVATKVILNTHICKKNKIYQEIILITRKCFIKEISWSSLHFWQRWKIRFFVVYFHLSNALWVERE